MPSAGRVIGKVAKLGTIEAIWPARAMIGWA